MATTAQNFKQLILVQSGESNPHGTIGLSIDVLWDMYSDKALIAPRLQYFYVLVEALNMKIGTLLEGCNMADAAQARGVGDVVKALAGRVEKVEAGILKLEKGYGRVRPVVSGTLTTTEPIGPDDDPRTIGSLDANDRLYRGDAYLGGFGSTSNGRLI